MGAISTGSLSISTWVNKENALAAYNGLHLNRFWEIWIISNNSIDQKSMPSAFVDALKVYNLFTTFSRAEYLLSSERVINYGYFPNPRGPYFYAALLLVVLNVAKSFKSIQASVEKKNVPNQEPVKNSPTGMDRFLVVVSKATPYLMVVTNIAVTTIQIRSGEASAWLTLVFMGITLIDVSSWKPKAYEWYRDTVLAYPVSAAAFYFANNKLRLFIIFKLALNTQTVKKMVADTVPLMQIAIKELEEHYKNLPANFRH